MLPHVPGVAVVNFWWVVLVLRVALYTIFDGREELHCRRRAVYANVRIFAKSSEDLVFVVVARRIDVVLLGVDLDEAWLWLTEVSLPWRGVSIEQTVMLCRVEAPAVRRTNLSLCSTAPAMRTRRARVAESSCRDWPATQFHILQCRGVIVFDFT